MNYGLIEDTLHAHEKALDPEHLDAMGMWALALSWCRAYAKDGRVPPALPTRLAGGKRRGRKLAARLVAIRLWDVDGEGWRFHDWSEFYGPDLPSETQNDLPPPPPEPQHGEALSKGAERTRRWRENRTRKDVTGVTNNVTSVTNTVTGDVTRDVGRDGVTRHGDASRVSLSSSDPSQKQRETRASDVTVTPGDASQGIKTALMPEGFKARFLSLLAGIRLTKGRPRKDPEEVWRTFELTIAESGKTSASWDATAEKFIRRAAEYERQDEERSAKSGRRSPGAGSEPDAPCHQELTFDGDDRRTG